MIRQEQGEHDAIALAEDPLGAQRVREQYVDMYAHLVESLDFVKAVYVDDWHGLTIYTVYQGDRRTASDHLYDAYAEVIDRFPQVPVDFRRLDYDRLESSPVPTTARRVFAR